VLFVPVSSTFRSAAVRIDVSTRYNEAAERGSERGSVPSALCESACLFLPGQVPGLDWDGTDCFVLAGRTRYRTGGIIMVSR
jgi:hypothetical protein